MKNVSGFLGSFGGMKKVKWTVPDFHFVCDSCKGKGVHFTDSQSGSWTYSRILVMCKKCDGEGYVDWARNPLNYNEREEV